MCSHPAAPCPSMGFFHHKTISLKGPLFLDWLTVLVRLSDSSFFFSPTHTSFSGCWTSPCQLLHLPGKYTHDLVEGFTLLDRHSPSSNTCTPMHFYFYWHLGFHFSCAWLSYSSASSLLLHSKQFSSRTLLWSNWSLDNVPCHKAIQGEN